MSVSITVSDEIYEQARSIAEAHHIPVDDVFAKAFAEQFSAWQRLQERVKLGDRDKFVAVLNKVPDIEPEAYDRI